MSTNTLRRTLEPCMGHRQGTAIAPAWTLFAVLGEPTHDWRSELEPDGTPPKVTLCWNFKTPRGNAEVRDYWWNASDEWSIAAPNRKAGMWLARHLRRLGIVASTRIYSKAAPKGYV